VNSPDCELNEAIEANDRFDFAKGHVSSNLGQASECRSHEDDTEDHQHFALWDHLSPTFRHLLN
jgi:hypothetical protein